MLFIHTMFCSVISRCRLLVSTIQTVLQCDSMFSCCSECACLGNHNDVNVLIKIYHALCSPVPVQMWRFTAFPCVQGFHDSSYRKRPLLKTPLASCYTIALFWYIANDWNCGRVVTLPSWSCIHASLLCYRHVTKAAHEEHHGGQLLPSNKHLLQLFKTRKLQYRRLHNKWCQIWTSHCLPTRAATRTLTTHLASTVFK